MTRQVGSEIDEFVTGALRNNLLGLPLDLAAINIARGRDTGVPTLNDDYAHPQLEHDGTERRLVGVRRRRLAAGSRALLTGYLWPRNPGKPKLPPHVP